jgi:hypothetical protein
MAEEILLVWVPGLEETTSTFKKLFEKTASQLDYDSLFYQYSTTKGNYFETANNFIQGIYKKIAENPQMNNIIFIS